MKRIILTLVATMWCLTGVLQAQETRKMQVFYGGNVVYTRDVNLVDSINFVLSEEDYVESGGYLSLNLQMVKVEGGTFTMGCESEQTLSCDHSGEVTQTVTLSSYYISKYEITQAQWKAVMGTTIEEQRDAYDGSLHGAGDDHPMYYVSWTEAKAFCDSLSKKTGKKYALPTEAQWEFAARGGVKSKSYKYSGSNTIGDVAWYYDNGEMRTHAVGSKQANELGIYDMSGNVWEWCADWSGSYSSEAVTNPTGPDSGSERVARGGGWGNPEDHCRVSFHGTGGEPDHSNVDLGFRVVCLP